VAETWTRQLARWSDAGLIDDDTAARIRAFEEGRQDSGRLRWTIWIALLFGALTIGAGTLLFVSAHWDSLSPSTQFALAVSLVALFHAGGAATSDRFPAMSTALHALGTVALGAGIYLAGQTFNLDEHWPGGVMLWALGAALAWAVLRSWPQTAAAALLVPAWLVAEWTVAIHDPWLHAGFRVSAAGIFLLALAYFTNVRSETFGSGRRTLLWLGGIGVAWSAGALAFASEAVPYQVQALSTSLRIVGWAAAVGIPFVAAILFRRADVWPNVVATVWTLALFKLRPLAGDVSMYLWWALGATALAAWGVRERRTERINMGAAIFAATVLVFYFSTVMDKLGRSASLIALGVLFLGGGWTIERARRRLVLQTRGGLA